MDHEQFKQRLEDLGFDVEEDTDDTEDGMKPPIKATNQQGDTIWWSLGADEEWGLYIDPERYTLDDAFLLPREVRLDSDALVIEGATGTKIKDVGYGRAAFDGTMRITKTNTSVTETRTV